MKYEKKNPIEIIVIVIFESYFSVVISKNPWNKINQQYIYTLLKNKVLKTQFVKESHC